MQSHEGCTNKLQKGGACIRHGIKTRKCNQEGCTDRPTNTGVGELKIPKYSKEGCTNIVVNGGICIRYEVKHKECSYKGCTSYASKEEYALGMAQSMVQRRCPKGRGMQ